MHKRLRIAYRMPGVSSLACSIFFVKSKNQKLRTSLLHVIKYNLYKLITIHDVECIDVIKRSGQLR